MDISKFKLLFITYCKLQARHGAMAPIFLPKHAAQIPLMRLEVELWISLTTINLKNGGFVAHSSITRYAVRQEIFAWSHTYRKPVQRLSDRLRTCLIAVDCASVLDGSGLLCPLLQCPSLHQRKLFVFHLSKLPRICITSTKQQSLGNSNQSKTVMRMIAFLGFWSDRQMMASTIKYGQPQVFPC